MGISAVASALVLIAGTSADAPAGSGPAPHDADQPATRHARVALIAEQRQFVPGTTAYLGLHFKLDPHWHTYWLGTAKAEGQLELTLELPAGMTLGAIQWPAPRRLVSEGDILDHIYENEVTLILPVDVSKSAKPGDVTITGAAKYLICDTSCVFEEASLTLKRPVVAAGTPEADPSAAPLFRAARARLPRPLGSGTGEPTAARTPTSVTFDAPGAGGLSFFPAADCLLLTDLVAAAHADRPRLVLSPEPGGDASAPLRGVLEVRYPDHRGTRWFAVEPATSKAAEPASPATNPSPH